MSRYIDVDFILTEARNIFSDMGDYKWLKVMLNREDAPSIEIVRCKECIFADGDDKAEMYRCCSVSFPHWNKGEHFCSYGERREP